MQILPNALRPESPASEFWQSTNGRPRHFSADEAWGGFPVLEPPQEPFWVLAPGSVADSRRWPVERFATLARLIVAETGLRGVVVGGDSDAPLARSLCADSSLRLVDCTARGPIPILRRHFQQAAFTVANDSGLAHVASLCGSPVQVVWGAGNPRHTRPLGPGRVQVISTQLRCWPCERNTCERTDGPAYECLDAITPEAVWRQIREGLLTR
jgi:ADP-heptose:LPS heptosyltransferase